MKGPITKWLFPVVLMLAVVSFESCKKKNRDGEIQTAFTSKVQSDPNLAGVTATVQDGVVTLTGSCADENCRTNAEKSVKDIDGVDKVVNNIQVAPVVVSGDETLRNGMQSVVSKYDGVQADVTGGVITLRGTIKNREDLQSLMQELSALRPQRIDNQLVIKK